MDRLSELDYFILDSLADDDERFECVYCSVNDIPYINHDTECKPLYTSLFQFPTTKQFTPKEVLKQTEKLIGEGFIDCLTVVKNEDGDPSSQKVISPNIADFRTFARCWLNLTEKGKAEIEKDIYKDYYDKF